MRFVTTWMKHMKIIVRLVLLGHIYVDLGAYFNFSIVIWKITIAFYLLVIKKCNAFSGRSHLGEGEVQPICHVILWQSTFTIHIVAWLWKIKYEMIVQFLYFREYINTWQVISSQKYLRTFQSKCTTDMTHWIHHFKERYVNHRLFYHQCSLHRPKTINCLVRVTWLTMKLIQLNFVFIFKKQRNVKYVNKSPNLISNFKPNIIICNTTAKTLHMM